MGGMYWCNMVAVCGFGGAFCLGMSCVWSHCFIWNGSVFRGCCGSGSEGFCIAAEGGAGCGVSSAGGKLTRCVVSYFWFCFCVVSCWWVRVPLLTLLCLCLGVGGVGGVLWFGEHCSCDLGVRRGAFVAAGVRRSEGRALHVEW